MKVISLVPSWTETLIDNGVEVIGRTRYCIHPSSRVENIPIVGGTKDIKWAIIADLKADIVLVDKEENRQEVEEKCPLPFVATHVRSLKDLPTEILSVADQLKLSSSHQLRAHAKNWDDLLAHPMNYKPEELPGVLQWIRKTDKPIKKIRYIIWKNPWMEVSKDTFIGSVLCFLGQETLLNKHKQPYPQMQVEELSDPETLYLFSSEPYSFGLEKEVQSIQKLNVPAALVDGESFSWFGSRSFRFLSGLKRS